MQFRAKSEQMKMKKRRRIAMRKIRQETGLSLPVASKIARFCARGFSWDAEEKFPEIVMSVPLGCECCGTETRIVGPKGFIRFHSV